MFRYSRRTFIATLAAPALAQSKKLTAVAPGVWFRTGFSNTIIIEMKEALLVVDSGMKATAEATLADCKALSPKPVKTVFLTHHHFDHVEGNAVWTAAGATTLAFAAVRAEMDRLKSESERPAKLIDGSLLVLEDPLRRVELHHYGWAHTRGDGVLYLPHEKVLCTGDVVLNGPYNFLRDSDPRNWPKVIAACEKLDVRHVLPGHGKPAGKALLTGQRGFIEALTAAVSDAITRGQKLTDLVEMKDGKPSVSRLKLPQAYDLWAKDSFAPTTGDWPIESPHSGSQVAQLYALLAR